MSDTETAAASVDTSAPAGAAPDTSSVAQGDQDAALRDVARSVAAKYREEHPDEPTGATDAPTTDETSEPPKPADATPAPSEPVDDPDEPELRKILKARELKADARKDAEEARQAKSEAAAMLAEARRLSAEAANVEARLVEEYRANPTAWMRKRAVDPNIVYEDVVRDTSPEAETRRTASAIEQRLAAMEARQEAREKALETQMQRDAQARDEQERAAATRVFVSRVSESTAPHLHALYKPPQIAEMAWQVVHALKAKGQPNVDDAEILRVLEYNAKQEAKERAAQLARLAQLTGGLSAASGDAPQIERAKPRTPTPSAQSLSERRATPKPIDQMTPDELDRESLRAAKEAAANYRKSNGKAASR